MAEVAEAGIPMMRGWNLCPVSVFLVGQTERAVRSAVPNVSRVCYEIEVCRFLANVRVDVFVFIPGRPICFYVNQNTTHPCPCFLILFSNLTSLMVS